MADLQDFKVTRDEEGNVEPVEDETPKYGFPIKVKPLTIGDTHNLEGWGDASTSDWSLDDKIYLLRNNLIDAEGWDGLPDDDDEAKRELQEVWSPYAIQDLVNGIFFASGLKALFSEGKIKEIMEGAVKESDS